MLVFLLEQSPVLTVLTDPLEFKPRTSTVRHGHSTAIPFNSESPNSEDMKKTVNCSSPNSEDIQCGCVYLWTGVVRNWTLHTGMAGPQATPETHKHHHIIEWLLLVDLKLYKYTLIVRARAISTSQKSCSSIVTSSERIKTYIMCKNIVFKVIEMAYRHWCTTNTNNIHKL